MATIEGEGEGGEGLYGHPNKIVWVNSVSDLPVPISGEHRLLPYYIYDMNGNFINTPNTIVFPSNGSSLLMNGNIIYTGANAAFKLAALNRNSRNIRNVSVQATHATGKIFDISASGAGLGAPFILDTVAGISIDGLNPSCSQLGTISGVTLVIRIVQLLEAGAGLIVNDMVAGCDLSTLAINLKTGATGTLLTFGGTYNGVIQLKGYSPTIDTGQKGIYFNPATTFQGVSWNGSVPQYEGSATSEDIFQSGSLNQSSEGFKFTGNVDIPDSTISGEFSANGNSTYTTVPAVDAFVFINSGVSFTGDSLERTTIETNGTVTYTGNEKSNILMDGNVNMDPQTASKLLKARFMTIDPEERTVTFTNATDVVNEVATPRVNGDTITFVKSTGTLPTGLRKDVTYYVINKTADTFQLSHTLGGAAVTFTTDGTGTNIYNPVFLHGSVGRANITAADPVDVIPQALIPVKKNTQIRCAVANGTDTVSVLARDIFYRVKR